MAIGISLGPPAWATAGCPPGYADVNADGLVNVNDVQCLILAALWSLSGASGPLPVCLAGEVALADLNCSASLGPDDIQLSILLSLGQTLPLAVDPNQVGCASGCQTDVSCGLDPAEPLAGGAGCSLPLEAVQAGSLSLVSAFPNLPLFEKPVFVTNASDGSGRIFVIEQTGRIRVFDGSAQATSTSVFLDFSGKVAGFNGEGGLLGLAFAPDFAASGEFYVSYTRQVGSAFESVFSRLVVSADPNAADPASEEVLLVVPQPFTNHNGGWIGFGPDSYLYIALGDGGAACGITGDGQDPHTLRGSILRIDVNSASPGMPYAIPADNPWADGVDAAPETWAYGLRNPWRASFDSVTGALWLGDVGQGAVEEVNVIAKGGNYGWEVMEGKTCQPKTGTCVNNTPPCSGGPYLEPVALYNHSVGRSITGGVVYRGSAIPALQGSYIYGDFVTNAVFVWPYTDKPAPTAATLSSPQSVASFGTDEAGEVYLVGYQGRLYRFEVVGQSTTPPNFPQTLSETGCFSDVPSLTPSSGLVPYQPRAELWSDAALKRRWVSMPAGESATYSANGPWSFPAGTTFVKHFEVETTPGDPASTVRLETRLLAVDESGVRGYTYRWNDEGTEAHLLAAGATRQLTIAPPNEPPYSLQWTFPSRPQCQSCHTPASGGVLGLDTRQLNHAIDFGCGTANQIAAWRDWGLVSDAPSVESTALPSFANPADVSAPASARARAFLHANCAHCHQPGGATGTGMDLRGSTPTGQMGLVAQPSVKASTGESLFLVHPGLPDQSELMLRLTTLPPLRMPPLGTTIVPEPEVAAVRSWIENVALEMPCPTSGATGKPTNYGLPWAQGQAGVKYHAAANLAHFFMAWDGVNLQVDDVFVALRWAGAPTSTAPIGGANFGGGGWSAVLAVYGPGQICLFLASQPAAGCIPSGSLQHYAGWSNLPSTTVRIPWTTLGAGTAPEEVDLLAWTNNDAGTYIWSTGPAINPTGEAAQTLSTWHTLPAPSCLAP